MGFMIILLLSVGAVLGITIYRLALTNRELKVEGESLRKQLKQLQREADERIVHHEP